MNYNRIQIADLILSRLEQEEENLRKKYLETQNGIGHFYIDDLLPEAIATYVFKNFPRTDEAVLKKSLREFKYIAVQMDKYHPILEELVYAFQDERVMDFFQRICHIQHLVPDSQLYAGGLSLMEKENFLNPHLDNSHDKDRNRWRVLNLLYYVTPGWQIDNGGNLELWPDGLKADQITITSKFNRLAVMATHQASWHSVSKVYASVTRCCVSNYYFSSQPLREDDRFHVTSFRAWPKKYLLDLVLRIDNGLRMGIRKIFSKGIRENPHVYRKDQDKTSGK